ncbi:MAG: SsgA family sporulation/cell division regulator [Marmoricola sp.]
MAEHAPRTGLICEELVFELADLDQEPTPVTASLLYDPRDPWAVTLDFGEGSVHWTFARDLLVEGLDAPAGIGDVQVWPTVDRDGVATTVLALSSPDGVALLQGPTRPLAMFVAAMLDRVPLGAESTLVDLDRELISLTR